ncbi:MAG: hypothetical protein KF774_01770 [Planctomyces sp.]|nr:hypothetical protein [Planctomyces sp.]
MPAFPHTTFDREGRAGTAREYRLKSELRRAALWGSGGALLLAVVFLLTPNLRPQQGPLERAFGVGMFAALAVGLLVPLRTVLRVDDEGVWRRGIRNWRLWPWEAFAAGRIEFGTGRLSYRNPDEPIGRRTIDLSALDDADAEHIHSLIRRIWTPPPAAPLSDELEIRLPWPDRRRVTLAREGFTVTGPNATATCVWDDVQRLRFWRLEADRPDFREMELMLPDQSIRILVDPSKQTWSGGDSASVSALLLEHVDASRIEDFALKGPPGSREELLAREDRLERHWRERATLTFWAPRMGWMLTLAPLVLLTWPQSVAMSAITSLQALMVHAICWDQRRKYEAALQELHVERQAFEWDVAGRHDPA